jgi:hypothetical protein
MSLTNHRKQPDCAQEIKRIPQFPRYRSAQTLHRVLDHLNTPFENSCLATVGVRAATGLLSGIRFPHTPKHASWLNRAEMASGILSRPSIRGRIPTAERLTTQA